MEYQNLGTSDIQISKIIMGTWQAGKTMWTGIQDESIQQALQKALELGITTFDTAEIYGNGYSEKVLGKIFKNNRSQVIIASKVFCSHLQQNQVTESCNRSLKNLQTDYLDLYQIHWPSGVFASRFVPISETMTALNNLKEKGKIRAIGVSNFSLAQLKEAMQYGKIESIQPPFSLFFSHVAEELIPFCEQNKISILGYSPLAQGLLTGKFGKKHSFSKEDNRALNKLFQKPHLDHAQTALQKLQPIAERHNVTLANLAIAWVLAHPQTSAIVGARNSTQVAENALSINLKLTPQEVEEMKQIATVVTKALDGSPIMWGEPTSRRRE